MFEFISWIITDYFIVWFLIYIFFASLSSVQTLFGINEREKIYNIRPNVLCEWEKRNS